MAKSKLRVIQDYAKLSLEIKEQMKLVYPDGFSDYLIEFKNSKGELVSALPFETSDKIYMVRMSKIIADKIIDADVDYDDDGNLKDHMKSKYEDKHSNVEYLSDNENYND